MIAYADIYYNNDDNTCASTIETNSYSIVTYTNNGSDISGTTNKQPTVLHNRRDDNNMALYLVNTINTLISEEEREQLAKLLKIKHNIYRAQQALRDGPKIKIIPVKKPAFVPKKFYKKTLRCNRKGIGLRIRIS